MSHNFRYSVNHSDVVQIAAHLFRVDSSFEPALSSRTDIQCYAKKLHARAVRFEAWFGDKLIGLVASYCNQPDGGKSFVTSVSVLPDCHGLGIANQLMRNCIKHSRDLGFRKIELEVNIRSLPAIGLYHKLGFTKLCENESTLTMEIIFKPKKHTDL